MVELKTVNFAVPGSNPGCGVYKYSKKYENIMENLRIRCKSCNRELEGRPSKTVSCGCSNMATIVNNSKITALDLNNIVMLNSPNTKKIIIFLPLKILCGKKKDDNVKFVV